MTSSWPRAATTRSTDKPDPTDELLREPLAVVNVGLHGFAESLEEQEVEVVQVDWSPPAGGDPEMIDLLEKLL